MARFFDQAAAEAGLVDGDLPDIGDRTGGLLSDVTGIPSAKITPDVAARAGEIGFRDTSGLPQEGPPNMGQINSPDSVYSRPAPGATDSEVEQDRPDPADFVHKISAQLHDLGRVKSNVADMIRQGASESEIDAYVKAEGTTPEAIKALDQKSIGKYIDDIGRSLALGATFGFADKIAAALDSITKGGTYEENLKKQREQSSNVPTGIKLPAEIAGAVGSSVAAAPLTGGLSVISGASRLPGIVRAIGSGAGIGGLTAAGESDNVTPGEVATGAAIGGVTAGVLQPIIGGVTALARPIIRRVRDALNPEDAAARNVAGALQRDIANGSAGMTPSGLATAKGAGLPVANADLGGETTRALARSAANTSPEARAVINDFADDRFGGQSDRATEFVRGLIGAKGDIGAMTEQIENTARKANAVNYKTAYEAGDKPIWSPVLERLSASSTIQAAMHGAENKWRDFAVIDGFGAMNPPARVANGGILKFDGKGLEVFPNIQYWDYVQRDLTAKAFEARGGPDAARYSGLANAIKSELDRLVPQFKDARVGASGFFGAENALEAGQNFLSRSVDINDATRAVDKMSPEDQELFKFGFAGGLLNKISQVGDRSDLAKRIGADPDARQRIALALGPNDGKKLMAFIDAEGVMSKFKSAVQDNSKTAQFLTELGMAGAGAAAYEGLSMINDPNAMVHAALVYGLTRGNKAVGEKVAQAVAKALTSDDPRILLKGIDLISKDQNLGNAFRDMAVRLGGRVAAQGAASVATQPLQVTIPVRPGYPEQ